jgi:geranylgeranyl diphosphate synthase type I
VKSYLPQKELAAIETALKELFDLNAVPVTDSSNFGVMLRYPMGWVDQHGQPNDRPTGKRIRPLMVLFCAEAAGGDWREALPAAVAVEVLHNFSLVHDDIEDSSTTRHGRPTVWQIWGVPAAINIGDAMFTLAFQALHRLADSDVSPEVILEALHAFSDTAFTLTHGQHLDMRFESEELVSVDAYLTMIQGKTAALVSLSAYLGALIATEDPDVAMHYGNFALGLGISFQIHDDILGIWGDPKVTGKSAASDILSRKKSLPVLYGLTKSDTLRNRYADPNPFSDQDVTDIIKELEAVDALTFAQQMEQVWNERALAELEAAEPAERGASKLRSLMDALFDRQS